MRISVCLDRTHKKKNNRIDLQNFSLSQKRLATPLSAVRLNFTREIKNG